MATNPECVLRYIQADPYGIMWARLTPAQWSESILPKNIAQREVVRRGFTEMASQNLWHLVRKALEWNTKHSVPGIANIADEDIKTLGECLDFKEVKEAIRCLEDNVTHSSKYLLDLALWEKANRETGPAFTEAHRIDRETVQDYARNMPPEEQFRLIQEIRDTPWPRYSGGSAPDGTRPPWDSKRIDDAMACIDRWNLQQYGLQRSLLTSGMLHRLSKSPLTQLPQEVGPPILQFLKPATLK